MVRSDLPLLDPPTQKRTEFHERLAKPFAQVDWLSVVGCAIAQSIELGSAPDENWLPINRSDLDLSINLRIYVPDVEKLKTWKAPKAEKQQDRGS